MYRFFFILFFSTSLIGCVQHIEHTSVPAELTETVQAASNRNIRAWGDVTDEKRISAIAEQFSSTQSNSESKNILALSGGGANGAFGAGLLTAWSESGSRPDFDMVTGVSTGAIISVFAFLGSDYDHKIIDFYTNYTDADLYKSRSIFTIERSTSLFDIKPFEDIVRETITPELLNKVAQKHVDGKVLLVGTTNLDTQRLSVWNMGAIAALGTAESEILFENIILASTAVPGAMPAVQIDVRQDGKNYQEVHVDGGVARQVFLFPDSWDMTSIASNHDQNLNIYVIRNGEFLPRWSETEMTLSSVVSRSLETIIKYQGRGDVMQIYRQAKEANAKFHFAHIDEQFTTERDPALQFDQNYMKALYLYGYEQGRNRQAWSTEPPVYGTQNIEIQ